jgi:hypothetical protein
MEAKPLKIDDWVSAVMAQAREHGFRVALQACEDYDADTESTSIYISYSHHPSTCKGLLYDGYGRVFGGDVTHGEDTSA